MKVKCIPTIHPASVLRTWEWRNLVVHDLKRVNRWSKNNDFPEIKESFILRPTFEDTMRTLKDLLHTLELGKRMLAVDIETRSRQISCIGIAWSKSEAICIPFICVERPEGYYTHQEELRIVLLLQRVLSHRNAECVGQNWQYDYQYIARQWGLEVNLFLDIMSEHHVQFPGLPKGLDFQSSLYRDIHIYWKDESKEWLKGMPEDTHWRYNCRDAVATFEIAEVLLKCREMRPLKETQYGTPYTIQQDLSNPVARACARGVRINEKFKIQNIFHIQSDIASVQHWLNSVLGREFNPNSNPQMQALFYEELQQPKILDRKTKKPTLNDEALEIIAKRDILLRPLCEAINHIRSLKNCLSVVSKPLDTDNRLRCQYSIPGTETFRFSSSTDPFGFGTNLQNITSGDRAGKDFSLPNLRRLVIPDEGYTMGEFDLPQADARVVAWEAEDESLIELFLDPSRHLHMENAKLLFPHKTITKKDIEYYHAKQGVHLTNYGGTPPVLAKTLGITVHEASQFQRRWFAAHPKIAEWHKRITMQLATKRYVENAFGYRRFYFDRIENTLKEALAWIPQSTVAIATNLGILNVVNSPELTKYNVQFLLQVHDSSVFQWPTYMTEFLLPKLYQHLKIEVPYSLSTPLIFQGGAKISNKSWGDCEEVVLEKK